MSSKHQHGVFDMTGGFLNGFLFLPLLGEMSGKWSNLTNIFQMGWCNHQLEEIQSLQLMVNWWFGAWWYGILGKWKTTELHPQKN